jgi:hypothetical protein
MPVSRRVVMLVTAARRRPSDDGGECVLSVDLRASDADRERVAGALREHTVAGRLTLDELSDRFRAAYAARTAGDLAALTADLPALDARGGRRLDGLPRLAVGAVAALVVVVLLVTVLVGAVGPALAAGGMAGMCH